MGIFSGSRAILSNYSTTLLVQYQWGVKDIDYPMSHIKRHISLMVIDERKIRTLSLENSMIMKILIV